MSTRLTWTIENDMTIPLETVKPRFTPLLPQIQELTQQIIASGKYVYGTFTAQLEAHLKEAWHISGQVVLTKSGTDALTLAAWAAGIDDGVGANGEGAPVEIICPNLTFPSSATAMTMAGLLRKNVYRLVFVDVHPRTLNVDPDAIAAAVTERTRAIVVPHLYGNPAAMQPILELARTHHLKVIEDTSQAHGARCAGWFVGTMGDVAAGSLYAYKNLGGIGDLGYVVVPDDAAVYRQTLRDRDLGRDMGERDLFHGLGLRTRPEEINAGVTLLQLPHLERKNARSRQIVEYYRERLLDTPIQMPAVEADDEPTYWRCALLLPDSATRSALRQHLTKQGIGNEVVYPYPVSEHGAYRNGAGAYDCRMEGGTPHAYDAASRVLCIPAWPELSDGQVERVVESMCAFFAQGRGGTLDA